MATAIERTSRDRFELPNSCVARLWSGWAAGAYELPPGLVSLGRAALALDEAKAQARAAVDTHDLDDATLMEVIVREAVNKTLNSGNVPADLAENLEARKAVRDREALRLRIIEAAFERVDTTYIAGAAMDERLVATWLRPSFDAVVAAAAELAPALASADVTHPESLASAQPAASTAYLRLTELAARMSAILAAVWTIETCFYGGTPESNAGTYWFVDCLCEPGPPIPPNNSRSRRGPSHPLERLLWLATDSDARPYLSTFSERQAAFDMWERRQSERTQDSLRADADGRSNPV
jgi:hypothetical protein